MTCWGERGGRWVLTFAVMTAHQLAMHILTRFCDSRGHWGRDSEKYEVSGFYMGSEKRGHARVKTTAVIYGDTLGGNTSPWELYNSQLCIRKLPSSLSVENSLWTCWKYSTSFTLGEQKQQRLHGLTVSQSPQSLQVRLQRTGIHLTLRSSWHACLNIRFVAKCAVSGWNEWCFHFTFTIWSLICDLGVEIKD